jgi:hypothetical protein
VEVALPVRSLVVVLVACSGDPEGTDADATDDTTPPVVDTDTDTGTPVPTDTDEPTVPLDLQASALYPWNGFATGSVWATSPELAVLPRRPVFVWNPSADATTYELEVDDSCDVPGFAACTFPSPELSVSTADTRHAPVADLPVSTVPPVGTRYFWRVRACADAACSEWTAVRYVDVGRSPKDFDGDGYADVIVGASLQNSGSTDEGNVFVYDGSPSGISPVPSLQLDNPEGDAFGWFGGAVACAGDVNGDGFADAVVGAAGQGITNDGAAFVFYGSADGLSSLSYLRLSSTTGAMGMSFGSSVAAAGDVDGDGFTDLLVGEDGGLYIDAPEEGHAFVFAGGPTGVNPAPVVELDNPGDLPNQHFGTSSVASIGDTNGDGFVDVVIGAPDVFGGGTVYVYLGAPTGLPDVPSLAFADPEPSSEDFGLSVASAGDVNGDDYADLVVSSSGEFTFPGHVYLYVGGSAGLPVTFSQQLDNPDGDVDYGYFGAPVASAGDVDGDGDADLIAGSRNFQDEQTAEGNAFLFSGEAAGVSAAFTVRLDNPEDQTFGFFSRSLASAGDVDGDGYDDVIVGAFLQNTGAAGDTCPVGGPPEGGCEGSAFLYRGSATGLADVPWVRLDDPDGEPGSGFGGSVD